MTTCLMLLAVTGFLMTNALETTLLTLSFSDERRLVKGLSLKGAFWKGLSRYYQGAFDRWRHHPAHFLSLVLVLNSFCSGLWCVMALSRFGLTPLAGLIVGAVLFVGGELLPKVLARRFPEQAALCLLPPFYVFFEVTQGVLGPLVRVVERFARWPQSLGLRYPLTEQELKKLLQDRDMTSDLRPRSRLALESIFDFSSRRVRQAMRPAKDVFVLDVRRGDLGVVLKAVANKPYSRIPVSRDGSLQEVMGILYVKDLLFAFATSGLLHLQDLLRECPVIEETERLGRAMERFRQGGIHLALVRDRSGEIKGLISLEDILEEIVGDIQDEYQ
ncbi:MAG: DUF21 domain-containing protein [Elusimicrobia bacterium]|nr:DUF21 domain-containing protein [Elusimicrobiota bacterium]